MNAANGLSLRGFSLRFFFTFGLFVAAEIGFAAAIQAATVTWDGGGGDGQWQTAANWGANVLPGPTDDVLINVASPLTVTLQSATVNIRSLQCSNALTIAGGDLTVNAGPSIIQGSLQLTAGRLAARGVGTSLIASGPTTLRGTALAANGGASLSLPALSALTRTNSGNIVLSADGAGSVLDLPNVTAASILDYYALQIDAWSGGDVRLPRLSSLAGAISAYADGTNSQIRLPGFTGRLANTSPGGADIEARDGGAINISNVTALHRISVALRGASQISMAQITDLTGAEFYLNSTVRSFPALTNVEGNNLTVENGAQLSLAGVRRLSRTNSGDFALTARGAGSQLILPNVTSAAVQDYYQLALECTDGGQVSLPALTNLSGAIDAYADDLGSLVDLPAYAGSLRNATPGGAYLEARNGGAIQIPSVTAIDRVNLTLRGTGQIPLSQVTAFTGAELRMDNRTQSLPGLTNVIGADLTVENGAWLTLAGVRQLSKTNGGDLVLTARSAGSTLRLPNASSGSVRDYYQLALYATDGGKVSLASFSALVGAIDAYADGLGSVVELPALSGLLQNSTPGGAYVEARNGGAVQIPNITALDRINLTLRGASQIPLSQVTAFTGAELKLDGAIQSLPGLVDVTAADLTVEGNAQLTLEGVTQLAKPVNGDLTFTARTSGILRLPNATTAMVRDYYQLALHSFDGGQVLMSRLNLINGVLDAYAEDAGSLIDLSGLQGPLTNATPGSAYLEVRDGATILLPNVTSLDRYNLTIRGTGQIPTAQLVAITHSTVIIDGAHIAFGGLADTTGSTFTYPNGGTAAFLPPADLRVTAILPPPTAVANQPVNLVWEITNTGTALTNAAWSDALFLSSDALPGGDILIGLVPVSGSLATGQPRRFTNTVVFPAQRSGTWYLAVAANQSRSVWEGTNTLNNTNISVTTFQIQAPDLLVDSVTVQPASTQFGQSVNVAWTVRNNGSIAANGGWTDRLYLNPAASPFSSAIAITNATSAGTLGAGQSRTNQATVTLPITPGLGAGAYRLIAYADAGNAIAEGSESNNTNSAALTLALPPLPDLLVARIEGPTSNAPAQLATFIWAVTNGGPAIARAPWTERLLLIRTNAGSPAQSLLLLTATNDLAAGAWLTRTQQVQLPDDLTAGTYQVRVELDSEDRLLEGSEANNARSADVLLVVPAVLRLQLPIAEANENTFSPGLTTVVSRNGNLASALTISLGSSLPGELAVPSTINLPAGVASGTFTATVQQDFVPDADQLVTLTASAAGYQPGTATFTVRNTDVPHLALELGAATVDEGKTAAVTIRHDAPTTAPVTVSLIAPGTAQLMVPETVTIPAGQSSFTFAVLAVDDSRIEPGLTARLEASAPGFQGASAVLSVNDNDLPEFSLTLATASVPEGAGLEATTATVSRGQPSPRSLTVALENSDPSVATIPPRVIIPAGQASVSFPVAAVDNLLVNEPQTALFQAFAEATLSGVRVAQSAPVMLTVTDDDGPTLTLTADRDVLAEGLPSATTLTVTRNSSTNQPLVVTLASSDTTEATVPSSLIIPVGRYSATASITTVDDGVDDGSQPVDLTATAAAHANGQCRVLVTDVNRPDLIITDVSGPTTGESESFANLSYRVFNQGLAPAGTNWVTRLLLSRDTTVGNDLLLAEYAFNGTLPVGQFFGQSRQVRLPLQPGDYWVVTVTDIADQIDEIREDNNSSISAQPIHISAAYDAVIATDVDSAPAGTQVALHGTATLASTGGPAQFVLVNIHVRVRGTERIFSSLSDENGHFAATFTPLPGEAGLYEIGAAHPGVPSAPIQDSFTLYGLKASEPGPIAVTEHSSVAGAIQVANLGDLPLTGATATVISNTPNLQVNVSLAGNGTIPALAPAQLGFAIAAGEASPAISTVIVRVTTAEGARVDIPLEVTVVSLAPRLVARPMELLAGMKRGGQALVSFDVVNEGGADSGPVQVVLPDFPWMHVVSANPLPSLAPGTTNRVTLQLTPAADLPLGAYTGNLALTTARNNVGVPYEIRALSEARGDLRITAVDEYTYYAEGAPKIVGATVTVRDAVSEAVITNGLTDSAGEFRLPQIPEGYYEVRIDADQHRGYRDVNLVIAGFETNVIAFLPREAVRYIWTVIPTEIQDRTRVTIETLFEAFVPMPVITIDPPLIDLADYTANVTQVELKISNHGLIAAQKARLTFGTHPDWSFEPLIDDLGDLPARSTLTVPLLIRKLGVAPGSLRAAAGGGGCSVSGSCNFVVPCGSGNQGGGAPVIIVNASGNCGGGGGGRPGGSGGGGGGGGGASGGGPGSSSGSVRSCDPCLLAILSCLIDFALPDIGSCLKDMYGCASSLSDAKSSAGDDAYNCAKAAFSCAEAAGKEVAKIPMIIDAAECIKGLSESCGSPLGGGGGGGGNNQSTGGGASLTAASAGNQGAQISRVERAELTILRQRSEWLMQEITPLRYLFGNDAWFSDAGGLVFSNWVSSFVARISDGSDLGRKLSETEISQLLTTAKPSGVTNALARSFCDRWNRTMDYWNAGIFSERLLPAGYDPDFLSVTKLRDLAVDVQRAFVESAAAGYLSPDAALNGAHADIVRFLGEGDGGGVCAHVRLRLEQEAVSTRDAFNAGLEIENALSEPLDQLFVEVIIRKRTGEDASALFAVFPPTLSGLTAVDGTGVIAPNSTGKVRWLLVPTTEAAMNGPEEFLVSGVLRYRQGALNLNVPLAAATITVHPSPSLNLKYFHQREVFADDPFTVEIEPSIPYSLAVMVENKGHGTARNVRITSGQPKIVDNEKGLFVDFKIIATEVAGQNLQPSLTVDFGQIPPGTNAIGRWLLTSTLLGGFIDYSASIEHLDGLGNKKLALVGGVEIHELNHIVRALGTRDDGRPDFLANDVADLYDRPDTLHLSDGSIEPVGVVLTGTVDGLPTTNDLQVVLNAKFPAGWAYLRIPDPGTNRFRLTRVVRSDGREIPVGENAWTTDRTFLGNARRPVTENILHLFDDNSAGQYTLFYAALPAQDITPPSSQVEPLLTESAAFIPVSWSGQDNAGGRGVSFYDVYVSIDGGEFLLWQKETLDRQAVYQGALNRSYAFYSVATDVAGNREEPPITPDARTIVTRINRAPTLDPIPNLVIREGDTWTFQPIAGDPDGDSLVFSLSTNAPPGIVLQPYTGRMTWVTGAGSGPSSYPLTLQVLDNGLPRLGTTRTFTVTVSDVNSPPVLNPVANRSIGEGTLLVITNQALDYDLPRQKLAFALGAGAPTGAAIDPDTGVFSWTPSSFQGGTINPFTVIVRDNGTPSLTATLTFTVVVRDTRSDFRVGFGATHVLTPQSGSLPLVLDSDADLAELRFDFEPEDPHLGSLELTAPAAEVLSASLDPIGNGRYRIQVELDSSRAQAGARTLASLGFSTASLGQSALASLVPFNVIGVRSSGESLTNASVQAGRLFLIEGEPLIDAVRGAAGGARLVVYAQPGTTIRLQQTHQLGAGAAWTDVQTRLVPGTFEIFDVALGGSSQTFFRVIRN